jgi:putative addiction module killer protein
MKIGYGLGYRVYYTHRNQTLVLLLCGGDKSTQDQDIKLAQNIAKQWEN